MDLCLQGHGDLFQCFESRELLSGPLITPKKTYQSNGVKFFPLNRSVLEYRRPGVGNPVTRVKDAIAETSRGICEEFHIWGSHPVGVGYDDTAVHARSYL